MSMQLQSQDRSQVLISSLLNCVTWAKAFNMSTPQVPHRSNEDNRVIDYGLNQIRPEKLGASM